MCEVCLGIVLLKNTKGVEKANSREQNAAGSKYREAGASAAQNLVKVLLQILVTRIFGRTYVHSDWFGLLGSSCVVGSCFSESAIWLSGEVDLFIFEIRKFSW